MPIPHVSPPRSGAILPAIMASTEPAGTSEYMSATPAGLTAETLQAEVAQTVTSAPRWFVLRAYKNEKKAEEVLSGDQGLPYFIPKQYAVRTYHGKKTKHLVPVIPGLVFVHATHADICEFKKRHNFLQFVMKTRRAGGQAAQSRAATSTHMQPAPDRATAGLVSTPQPTQDYLIVPDKQMADFIQVAGQHEAAIDFYAPEELHLEKGTPVRILGGPFDGVEGSFLKVQGARARRLVVQIPNTLAAVVSVEPDLVEVIKNR